MAQYALSTLVTFDGTNGGQPYAGLIADANGNLYGTTAGGGLANDGTVFEIAAGTRSLTTLCSFSGPNGSAPFGGLVFDSAGNLYGTTESGGSGGSGTVFQLTAGARTLTSLASFNGSNGRNPYAGLIIDANDNLYGTTFSGTGSTVGTVFELAAPNHSLTTLAGVSHSSARLAIDANGNLYVTSVGSTTGVIFKIPAGTHSVSNIALISGAFGTFGLPGLTIDSSGNLFGVSAVGGANNAGYAFEIPAGTNLVNKLAVFDGANGSSPSGSLIVDSSGNLYGTTFGGGTNGKGTVFELAAGTHALTTLFSFNGANGSGPQAELLLDSDGNLYGTTTFGGASNFGTVFELSPVPEPSTIDLFMVAGLGLVLISVRRRHNQQAELCFDIRRCEVSNEVDCSWTKRPVRNRCETRILTDWPAAAGRLVLTLVVAVRAKGLLFYLLHRLPITFKDTNMFHSITKRRAASSSYRNRSAFDRSRSRCLGLESLEPRTMLTGTWTPLTNLAPHGIGTMELLSDGTVMASASVGPASTDWYRLTPDANGSYVNGTWSKMASMDLNRLFFASEVLPDGRLLVLGGKYVGVNDTQDSLNNTGEIYDPVSNTWTDIANYPEVSFGDAPTTLTPDGKVLAGWNNGPQTFIYDPASNSWSPGPTKPDNDPSERETWTKLPNGGILTYDIHKKNNPDHAYTLDPATNTWVDSGVATVPLRVNNNVLGPPLLLPDGRVFYIGNLGNTAFYSPPTVPGGVGTWAPGPTISGGDGFGASAMLPNGHILYAGGVGTNEPLSPTNHMVEIDPNAPLATAVTEVTPPVDISHETNYFQRMLTLPTGQVLWTNEYQQLYVYTPDGAPNPAWKPTITNVAANGNHYTLTGTQLNGLSAGASYNGDGGAEMETNYPIIELKDGSGHAYFARTFNWSSTGVQTGGTSVTTDFTLPPGLPLGTYSLTVIANGIASNPVSFTGGVTGADVAVVRQGPSSGYNEGDVIPFTFTVTNYGPATATKVVVTDTLGANLSYSSATTTAGTVKRSGNIVTFSVGTLAVGQSATLTINAQATEDGTLSQTAVASSNVSDPNSANNMAVNSISVAEPPIVVSGPITVSGKNQSNVQVATFTHANGVEPASDFIATINWGDGTTSTGSITESGTTYKVKGSHTYAASGSHTVTTTVVEAGAEGNVTHALVVANSAPSDTTSSGKPVTTQAMIQPAATSGSPPKLPAAAVDQALTATTVTRGRLRKTASNEAAVDELFALL
jgi:uncharacterized repeat protein (TIGR01451 family)